MSAPNGDSCQLCGDVYHENEDDRAWMGLKCPGAKAPEEVKAKFRTELAEAYAAEVRRQAMITLETDDDYIERRHANWTARTRSDGKTKASLPDTAQVSVALQADCDMRTGTEVKRQKVAEVFQEQHFEIDVPHLTVPGEVPTGSVLAPPVKRAEGATDDDYQIYLDPPVQP